MPNMHAYMLFSIFAVDIDTGGRPCMARSHEANCSRGTGRHEGGGIQDVGPAEAGHCSRRSAGDSSGECIQFTSLLTECSDHRKGKKSVTKPTKGGLRRACRQSPTSGSNNNKRTRRLGSAGKGSLRNSRAINPSMNAMQGWQRSI